MVFYLKAFNSLTSTLIILLMAFSLPSCLVRKCPTYLITDLETKAHPLSFINDKESIKNDLVPIINKLEKYKIIGLGEGTHGTKEFNQIRLTLTEMLINDKGFNTICLENAFGNSYYLNKGLNEGKDIDELMKCFFLSLWQTEEYRQLLILVQNKKKLGDNITICGMDMNEVSNSAKLIREILTSLQNDNISSLADELVLRCQIQDSMWSNQNDPKYTLHLPALMKNGSEALGIINSIELWNKKFLSVLSQSEYQLFSEALLNCRHGFHSSDKTVMAGYTRDKMMADMITQIGQVGDRKIIIWAHNAHIANDNIFYGDGGGGMGGLLKINFPNQYFAMGTGTAFGTYSATSDKYDTKFNIFSAYTLAPLYPASWENVFAKFKYNMFYIDFSEFEYHYPSLLFKSIGYGPETKYCVTKKHINKLFDSYIFIRNSTASSHGHFTPKEKNAF